jgi:hypothetical protein
MFIRHAISNVPTQSLNKLESLALDIFSYDLSVPSYIWSQWLAHVIAYHLSLSSPSHQQPISRPSCNPHSIVRKAIEELVQSPVDSTLSGCKHEPVFLGLEERKREKEQSMHIDVIDIDLDADGPLREEYLPKRRATGASSVRRHNPGSRLEKQLPRQADKNDLPPPAKWSPAGDEPILREKKGSSGNYVAVQPQPPSLIPQSFPPLPYHRIRNSGYQQWSATEGYLPAKPSMLGHAYDAAHPVHVSTYHAYSDATSHPVLHLRSQSLSYDQENMQPINRCQRSYSQSDLEYGYSGIRTTSAAQPTAQWSGTETYRYQHPYVHPFGPYPGVNCQSTWLRT